MYISAKSKVIRFIHYDQSKNYCSYAKAAKAPKAKVRSVAPLAHGVGRRKSSVARVWLRAGKGAIVVNGKDFKEYFDTEVTRLQSIYSIPRSSS